MPSYTDLCAEIARRVEERTATPPKPLSALGIVPNQLGETAALAGCDWCWAAGNYTMGHTYRGDPGGATFIRNDGKTCQRIGALMQCN